jgi:thiosulfate dehydrogenase
VAATKHAGARGAGPRRTVAAAFALHYPIVSGGSRGRLRAAQAQPANAQPTIDKQQAELIQRGKLIFDKTSEYASAFVGNKLACNDCHIQSGTAAYAVLMIDLAGLFPMFSRRAGYLITLQNRIQECFCRSEAGRPLPETSGEIQALVAYIDWLSRNEVKGKPYEGRGFVKLPTLAGDPVKGEPVYASQCAGCHGRNGAGVPPVMPPVWGPDSYNDGAGMNDPAIMAPFLLHSLPQDHPGTLTPQQAYDIAAYIHTKPRPRFNQAYRSY